jgi:hypothetical protein
MKTSRRSVAVVSLTMVLVLMASLVASAQSTTKVLSTNFTLVNLSPGSNTVNISYYKQDGSQWRSPEVATLAAQGDQLIRRQYDDTELSSGSGSVVVGGQGALGAVVQIQTRRCAAGQCSVRRQGPPVGFGFGQLTGDRSEYQW